MADLVKIISKLTYTNPAGAQAAVTLGTRSGNGYAVVIQKADDPAWASAQLWRREALSVSETSGHDWVGYGFTIPSPGGGVRLALQYNGPNQPVSAAPYGDSVVFIACNQCVQMELAGMVGP